MILSFKVCIIKCICQFTGLVCRLCIEFNFELLTSGRIDWLTLSTSEEKDVFFAIWAFSSVSWTSSAGTEKNCNPKIPCVSSLSTMRRCWADVVSLPPKFTQVLTVCHRLNSVPCAKLTYSQLLYWTDIKHPIKLLVKRQSSTTQNSHGTPSSHPGWAAARLTKLTGYHKLRFAEVSRAWWAYIQQDAYFYILPLFFVAEILIEVSMLNCKSRPIIIQSTYASN